MINYKSKCEHRKITRIKRTVKIKSDSYTLTLTRCSDCGTQLHKALQEVA